VSVLIQKVTLREIDGLRATWLRCVVAVVVLLPFSSGLVSQMQDAPTSALLGVVYLGALPSAIAFTTRAYALTRMPAGRIGPLVGYLVTVLTALMSWAYLSEIPTAPVIADGLICLCGVTISRWRGRRARG
jgi:drug/metabolite transporter (DMT)-like permease